MPCVAMAINSQRKPEVCDQWVCGSVPTPCFLMGVQVKLLMGDPYNKRYLLRKPRKQKEGAL